MMQGGRFNPHLKKNSQIGNPPQVGVKIKHIWNHHLVIYVHIIDNKIYEQQKGWSSNMSSSSRGGKLLDLLANAQVRNWRNQRKRYIRGSQSN